MNVALIGSVSSSWTVLDALIRNGVEVTCVLGLDESEDGRVGDYRSLRELARTGGIPFRSFVEVTEPGAAAFLEQRRPDLLWVIGLSQLVPRSLVEIAEDGGVGFHPTLLPKGRGRAPVAWTILLDQPAAANLFFLTDEPDAGDLIAQRRVPVLPDDYAEDLIARTNDVLAELVCELAPSIKAGSIPRTPQDHSQATYYERRTPADGLIDWTASTDRIYKLVRAAGRPYPGAFSHVAGHKAVVWRARPDRGHEDRQGDPGTIAAAVPEIGLRVVTGDGAIWLTEVQTPSGVEADELLVEGAVLTDEANASP